MAKTTVEIPDQKMAELEAYRDRLGELLLLGLSQVKIQEALLLYQRGTYINWQGSRTRRSNRAGNGTSGSDRWNPTPLE